VTATATTVLNVARSQIGTTERPPGSNHTRYGAWYEWDGVAWCAIFVSWVADRAGANDIITRAAYTPSMAAWYQAVGRWGTVPRRGAVVFYDFPDSVRRIQHVGIVESVRSDGRIVAIEGNTSPDDAGSQDNGDGVYRRVRSPMFVVGYGYPRYAHERRTTSLPRKTRTVPLVVDGVWGRKTTAAVQRYLKVRADGVLGPVTRRAVQRWARVRQDGVWGHTTRKAVQRKLGVRVDGEWGPVTVRALQRFLNRALG
jgi:surface antigen